MASATPLCNRTRAVPLWRSEAKGFSVLLSACIRGLILKGVSEPFGCGMWAEGGGTAFFFFSWLPVFWGERVGLLLYLVTLFFWSTPIFPPISTPWCVSLFAPCFLGLHQTMLAGYQADWFVRDSPSNEHSSMNVIFSFVVVFRHESLDTGHATSEHIMSSRDSSL